MRYVSCFLCILLSACHFSPLYGNHNNDSVCVASIPEGSGYQMQRILQQYFPNTSTCHYTLKVTSPTTTISDQSISDKDFITTQEVRVMASYQLLNRNKDVILQSTLSTQGSSAVISSPYATVVATEKTQSNLEANLAEQIALHVAAFLDRDTQ